MFLLLIVSLLIISYHWNKFRLFQHCAPCLIDYDAVIKLETSKEDEDFVMTQSSMNQYINLEYEHYKSNGLETTNELRKSHYSNITCSEISKLEIVYKMDLEMFDYEVESFRKYCLNSHRNKTYSWKKLIFFSLF